MSDPEKKAWEGRKFHTSWDRDVKKAIDSGHWKERYLLASFTAMEAGRDRICAKLEQHSEHCRWGCSTSRSVVFVGICPFGAALLDVLGLMRVRPVDEGTS